MGLDDIAIQAEGLSCRRGERLLFDHLDVTARCGRLMEIVGPNGTGKTSLLRILAGLLRPESGRVVHWAEGRALGEDDPVALRLHYASHQDALKSQLSAAENLAFAASFFGARRTPDEALDTVGLLRQADLPVGYLSAGQKRRLALARCWMLQRAVWLLDEPTAALDSAGRMLVGDLITAHLAQGGTVLAATHETILAGADRLTLA